VTYDGCIRKHERSENFHTMNERVARELIRAFQHHTVKLLISVIIFGKSPGISSPVPQLHLISRIGFE